MIYDDDAISTNPISTYAICLMHTTQMAWWKNTLYVLGRLESSCQLLREIMPLNIDSTKYETFCCSSFLHFAFNLKISSSQFLSKELIKVIQRIKLYH